MTLLYIYTLYISVNCSFPLQKMVCNMYNNILLVWDSFGNIWGDGCNMHLCPAGCWRLLDICMKRSRKDLCLGPVRCFVTPLNNTVAIMKLRRQRVRILWPTTN